MPSPRPTRNAALFLLIASLGMALLAWYSATNPRIVVEWSTATELDTAGFNLYRSAGPHQPPVKINATLVPPAPDPLKGADYSYRDKDVIPGQTYIYALEEVEASGNINPHGTIEATASQGGIRESLIALLLIGAAFYIYWTGSRTTAG